MVDGVGQLVERGVAVHLVLCGVEEHILVAGVAGHDLRWNEERQHYDFGTIDWDEFWRVVGGEGPCNRERLAARVNAWNEGEWVREAALAHAAKQSERVRKQA